MAKVTTTKTKTKSGKTVSTINDTSKMTARQKASVQKKKAKTQMSKNAAIVSTVGEGMASATTTAGAAINADKEKHNARQRTYQAAIDKWNGILKSTPENAEGTNPGMQGTNNSNKNENSTGTNPDSFEGW